MHVKPSRRYNSPQRQEHASATRRHILDAAEGLFAERGYFAVTMDAIARQAGVSPATVYLHFAGRATVVSALAEQVVSAPDMSVEQVEQRSDPIEQVRIGARLICRLNLRSWLITDILRGASGSDAGLASVWTHWQARHLDAIRRAIASIARSGALRNGLAVEEAVDVWYAVAGPDVYRALVRERGWSNGRYEEWLFDFGCRELLG